jgi:hypothetical protein
MVDAPRAVIDGVPDTDPWILGARIWVSFVRSGGAKAGGIASSFEDFGAPGAGEDGLKPGCIDVEIIFARVLTITVGPHQVLNEPWPL